MRLIKLLLPILIIVLMMGSFFLIGSDGKSDKAIAKHIDVVMMTETGDPFKSVEILHDLGIRHAGTKAEILESKHRLFSMICHPETSDETQAELLKMFGNFGIKLAADEVTKYQKHMKDDSTSEVRRNQMFMHLGRLAGAGKVFDAYIEAIEGDDIVRAISGAGGLDMSVLSADQLAQVCRIKSDSEHMVLNSMAHLEAAKLVRLKDKRGLAFLLEGLAHDRESVSDVMLETHARLVSEGFVLVGAEAVIKGMYEERQDSLRVRMAMSLFSGDGKPSDELVGEIENLIEASINDEKKDQFSGHIMVDAPVFNDIRYYPRIVERVKDQLLNILTDSNIGDKKRILAVMVFHSSKIEKEKTELVLNELIKSEDRIVAELARVFLYDLKVY